MRDSIPGAKENPNYNATGISVVLHPVTLKFHQCILILDL